MYFAVELETSGATRTIEFDLLDVNVTLRLPSALYRILTGTPSRTKSRALPRYCWTSEIAGVVGPHLVSVLVSVDWCDSPTGRPPRRTSYARSRGDDPAHVAIVVVGGRAERRVERCDALDDRNLIDLIESALNGDLSARRLDPSRRATDLLALDLVSADHCHRNLIVGALLQIALKERTQHLVALALYQRGRRAEAHRGRRQELLLDPVHDRIRLADDIGVGDLEAALMRVTQPTRAAILRSA